MILVFLPALHSIWYRVKRAEDDTQAAELIALNVSPNGAKTLAG